MNARSRSRRWPTRLLVAALVAIVIAALREAAFNRNRNRAHQGPH